MRGLNDRKFLNLFQIVHRASFPDPSRGHRTIDDVEWRKDRHTFTGGGYSFSTEVHQLRRPGKDRAGWELMIVAEYWWDGRHEPLRSTTWAKALQGSASAIAAWFRDQDRSRPAAPP
ncbi:MAG TPA: hypothetical protein VMU85_10110 [Stellaceae bacterium]|nr:hypothetical protein [Stellaceae bacterium]